LIFAELCLSARKNTHLVYLKNGKYKQQEIKLVSLKKVISSPELEDEEP
jgi:hypothetical protein